MDKLKIAFYIGRSRENPRIRLWDRFVCYVDKSRYSHAELVLEEYEDGTCLCASSSARDGGVRFKRMILKPTHWDVVEIYGDRASAYLWMKRREGRGYDWIGLARTKFDFVPDTEKRYFCSEAVADMLGLEDSARYGPRLLYKVATQYLNRPWLLMRPSSIPITDSH